MILISYEYQNRNLYTAILKMDTELSLKKVLTTAAFNLKAREALVEFCCGSLTELAKSPQSSLKRCNSLCLCSV